MMQKHNTEAQSAGESDRTDRTWPLPQRAHAMRMSWHDLLFAHWAFAPSEIQRLLPKGITLDTFEGQAWIGVVPFRMSDVAPRWIPAIPWMSAFPELNVRTYVVANGKPGVWFFSLDATNPIAVRVARTMFHLPYMDATMSVEKVGDWYNYRSVRTHRNAPAASFVGRYRPTSETFHSQRDTLEHWLTARYCLYTTDRNGRVLRGEIDHKPWSLQRAELHVERNSMLASIKLFNDQAPHLLFVKDIHVRAWWNERV